MNCLPTIKKRIKDRKKEDRDDDKDDDCNNADDNNDDTDEGFFIYFCFILIKQFISEHIVS